MRDLRQVAHRVNDLAVDPDLEVEVGPEAEAGAVADPDHLALADALAHRDRDRLLVRVAAREAAAVVDAGVVAVTALGPSDRHSPVGDGVNRGARGHADVDPGMAGLPRA